MSEQCKNIEFLLYLKDDELTEAEKKRLNEHVHNCPDCQAEWDSIQETMIPDTGDSRVSEQMKAAVYTQVCDVVYQQQNPGSNLYRLAVQLVAAACVLLFVFFGYEQFYTLRKINQLEHRLANRSITADQFTPTQNQLLIVNVFFSWNDIQSFLGTESLNLKQPNQLQNLARFHNEGQLDQQQLAKLDSTLKSEFYAHLNKTKFINKEKIRTRINNYLHEVSLATKIYSP